LIGVNGDAAAAASSTSLDSRHCRSTSYIGDRQHADDITSSRQHIDQLFCTSQQQQQQQEQEQQRDEDEDMNSQRSSDSQCHGDVDEMTSSFHGD